MPTQLAKKVTMREKISGIKLHIGVDTNGLPHAMFTSTANLTDRHGALCMIRCAKKDLAKTLKVLADGGYRGETFAAGVKLLIGAQVEIVKCNEL